MIDQVYRGEEIFKGQQAVHAPDVIFIPKNFSYSIEPDKRVEKSVISTAKDHAPVLSGPHPCGVFMAYGPEFAKGRQVENLKIWDILPNILHYYRLPIPENLDGIIRHDFFDSDSEYARKDPKFYHPDDNYFEDFDNRNPAGETLQKSWANWL
jgi:predicted AlkP superfamily phosphohydrolase/phosphomutase